MPARGMLTALVLLAVVMLPSTAFSAFVEKWHTGMAGYRILDIGGDLAGNGSYQMITGEFASGGMERVAVRSAATGAVLAQSASTYKVTQVWLTDLDSDGVAEILFWDSVTGKLYCLDYSPVSSALPVRWSFVATTTWRAVDFGGNGSAELVTVEAAGAAQRVAVRSAATGALLAQTSLTYNVGQMWLAELDGNGVTQILFSDTMTGKLNCLTYNAPSTLTVRWSYVAPSTEWILVDLDGNGKPYLAFKQVAADPNYFIYDRNGVQVASFHPTGAPTGNSVTAYMRTDDYDGDGRQELLLDYKSGIAPYGDVLYVYESNSPVSVEAPGKSRALQLRASFPNPASSETRIAYTVPTAGSISLRLLDVTGREVRRLVNGNVQAGAHEAIWDGRDDRGLLLPAGAYFYELNAGGQRVSRSVVRLR